jgi:hypothetical protein
MGENTKSPEKRQIQSHTQLRPPRKTNTGKEFLGIIENDQKRRKQIEEAKNHISESAYQKN